MTSINTNKQLPQGEPLGTADAKASTAMEFNDKEIFIRQVFVSNPEKGCELLFKRYYAVLCNHAVRMVYSKELAEDIVADVFYKFWNKKMFENITTSYRAYLFRAVRNTAINSLKTEFGAGGNGALTEEMELVKTEDPFLIFEAEELSKLIEKTIQLLPQKCQAVFLMSRLDGKKNVEIASELNVSIKAVEAHISKALAILRNTIQKRNL